MSDFRFGVDDYRLDYHPHEGVCDDQDCIDWSKVECVEIDWVTFVRERTTTRNGKFRTKYGSKVPLCECCGYSIGDGRYNYCPKCGAKVVGE